MKLIVLYNANPLDGNVLPVNDKLYKTMGILLKLRILHFYQQTPAFCNVTLQIITCKKHYFTHLLTPLFLSTW
jgi:hypothetical protein